MNYYHIDNVLLTIISGPHALRSEYIAKLTGYCGNPELLDLQSLGLVPESYPELQEGYQHNKEVKSVYADRVDYGVEAIPLRSQDELVEETKQQIKMIEDARLQHLNSNIHPDALFMVYKGYTLGLPKASLFYAWCESIGLEMYHRIALTQNGQWDYSLVDFSTFTPKPCEVGEIWQEVSGTP